MNIQMYCRPARLSEQIRMHEIEPVERVIRVLDMAKHVRAAILAAMSDRSGVDYLELGFTAGYTDFVPRHHRKH